MGENPMEIMVDLEPYFMKQLGDFGGRYPLVINETWLAGEPTLNGGLQ